LIDLFGAKRDIKEKTLRVLHNLSFVEDPTRIFRALRFEQRFGFQLSKLTANLIENAVKMDFVGSLAGRRLFNELVLILEEEKVVPLIGRLNEFHLLEVIYPKLVFNEHMKELLGRIGSVVSWFKLLFLDEKYERWVVYFGGLVDELSREETKELMAKLSFTREETRQVMLLKEKTLPLLSKISSPAVKNSTLYHLLDPLSTEAKLFLMATTATEASKRAVSHYFTHLKEVRIEVNGKDLISLGLKPGKIFKKILDETLNAKLDGKLKTKEEEIKFVKEKFLT